MLGGVCLKSVERDISDRLKRRELFWFETSHAVDLGSTFLILYLGPVQFL